MTLVYDLASFDFSGMEQQSECKIWDLNRLVSIIVQIGSEIVKSYVSKMCQKKEGNPLRKCAFLWS